MPKKPENNKVALVSPYLLLITLNVNGLNIQSKDIEWLDGLKKQDPEAPG